VPIGRAAATRAGIDVTCTEVLMPLDSTEQHVKEAQGLLGQGKFHEASRAPASAPGETAPGGHRSAGGLRVPARVAAADSGWCRGPGARRLGTMIDRPARPDRFRR